MAEARGNSSVTTAPPGTARRSSMQTFQPARARQATQTSPLRPLPIGISS